MVEPHLEGGEGIYTQSDDQVNKRCKWNVFRVKYLILDVAFCQALYEEIITLEKTILFFYPFVIATGVIC
jgi:hypothetical protein